MVAKRAIQIELTETELKALDDIRREGFAPVSRAAFARAALLREIATRRPTPQGSAK